MPLVAQSVVSLLVPSSIIRPRLLLFFQIIYRYKVCRADNPIALCNDFKVETSVEDRSYDEVQQDALADVRRFLKSNDVNLQQSSKGGATCLWEAAELGNIGAVRAILQHPGVDPNKVRLESNTTPLFIAAYHGHKEVVKELLRHRDIQVNIGAVESSISPLYMAVQEGREGVVKALLRCKNIDVKLKLLYCFFSSCFFFWGEFKKF